MPFSTYLPEHMGTIALSPAGPFVAGSHAELTLTYTAGESAMVPMCSGR